MENSESLLVAVSFVPRLMLLMHNNAPPRLLPRLLCRSTCSHFLPSCSPRQQVPITVVAPCANLECENAAHSRGDEEGYERSDASAAASCVVVSLPSVVAAAAIVAMISPKASFTGTQCFPLALGFFFFLGSSSSSLAVLLFLFLVTANMTHADSSSSASPPLSCSALVLVLPHGQHDTCRLLSSAFPPAPCNAPFASSLQI